MNKKVLLTLVLLVLCMTGYGQALQTIKTYHDPFTRSRLYEVYTVIKNSGLKHGSFKEYHENGNLILECNYNRNVLHGNYKYYNYVFGEIETGQYNNGKQNGRWTYHNMPSWGKQYLKRETVYDNDDPLKSTKYFSNGQKESYIEFNDDIKTLKRWYEDGTMELDATFRLSPKTFYENLIRSLQYNKKGILTQKLEDGFEYTYAEDGSGLLEKKSTSGNDVETYEKGQLKKSVREEKEKDDDGSTIYEIIQYENGNEISRRRIDNHGRDIEEKKLTASLKNEYILLYTKVSQAFVTFPKLSIVETKSHRGQHLIPVCEEQVIMLKEIYEQRKSELKKIQTQFHQLPRFEHPAVFRSEEDEKSETMKKYLNKLEDFDSYIQKNYVPQRDTLLAAKPLLEQIAREMYTIDYDYKVMVYRKKSSNQLYIESIEKKNLFAPYMEVSDYLIKEIGKGNITGMNTPIRQYKEITTKMLNWQYRTRKTSGVEKLLKNAMTPEEKLQIFLTNEVN